MATKNSAELIDEVVNYLDKQVTVLTHREKINVQMRVDETISILQYALSVAKDDQQSRKYDLTQDKTGACTIVYTVNGETASTGANVLKYGDKLVITVTASTGSTITKLQVNGKNYTSGTEITVDTDIALTVISTLNTYNLTVTAGENTTVTVTKGADEIEAGTGVLTYGDEIVISAEADDGYTLSTFTINGESYATAQTITVSGNVAVVTEATATPPAPEVPENNG